MGQQQLILIVLVTVIVGVAIVIGVRAFRHNLTQTNSDALIQDALKMSNDLVAWKDKPAQMGGQDDDPPGCRDLPSCFTGATWNAIGYSDRGTGAYENENGFYVIVNQEGLGAAVVGCNPATKNIIGVYMRPNELEPDTYTMETSRVVGRWKGDCP